jgi:hypothetical protein
MLARPAVSCTLRAAGAGVPRHRGVLAAASILLAVATTATPAAAQTAPYGILVNGIDHTTARSRIAADLQQARDAGAHWVRTDFWWYSVQWNRGPWDWRFFDAVVDEAAARGLELVPILWGTPTWAATDGRFSYGVPDMAAWEAFVAATVARYRGRITLWEIWNEPDGPWYWTGSAGQYAELLARAYRQVKLADPNALVLLGGLAQGGGAVPDFLQRILADARYPAGASFDVHNIHTNFRSMAGITDQIGQNRAVLGSYGVSRPIVVTEASYTSDPAYQVVAGYADGEPAQARYVTDAYRTMLGAGVELAVWASLRDYAGSDAYAGSGLVRTDGTAKAAFAAYRQAATAASSSPPAISSLRVSARPRRATVSWATTRPADSTVEYGLTSALGRSQDDAAMTTVHSVVLTGLQPGGVYYFRVSSRAADGSVATTAVQTFTTANRTVTLYPDGSGRWLLVDSAGGTAGMLWGAPTLGDQPVPADYDGDGWPDVAVYRRATAEWFIVPSANGGKTVQVWGAPMVDRPVPADYDGDGRADLAVYRETTGQWLVLRSSDAAVMSLVGGAPMVDRPVPADYDGDGRADLAVYRETTGQWFILRSSDGAVMSRDGGAPTIDRPVPADYDGDGRADVAVYRGTTGQWLILRSRDGGITTQTWGSPELGDQPMPADYDGDGVTDVAVFRPTTGEWFIRRSADGAVEVVTLGTFLPYVVGRDVGADVR